MIMSSPDTINIPNELEFHWPEVFTDEQLIDQIRRAESKETRLSEAARSIGSKAVEIETSDNVRDRNVLETAEVISNRVVTDRYNVNHEPAAKSGKNTSRRDVKLRAPETQLGRSTYGVAMDEFSDTFSPVGPNGRHIRGRGKVDVPAPAHLSFLDRRAQMLAARRRSKQGLKQARSRHAEVVAGGGIGLGVRSKHASRVERRRRNAQSHSEYLSGNITADQHRINRRRNRTVEVQKPTHAVSKLVRKERRSAMLSLTKVSQPLRTPVRTARKYLNQERQVIVSSRLDQVKERKAALEAEARRRHLIEEDDN